MPNLFKKSLKSEVAERAAEMANALPAAHETWSAIRTRRRELEANLAAASMAQQVAGVDRDTLAMPVQDKTARFAYEDPEELAAYIKDLERSLRSEREKERVAKVELEALRNVEARRIIKETESRRAECGERLRRAVQELSDAVAEEDGLRTEMALSGAAAQVTWPGRYFGTLQERRSIVGEWAARSLLGPGILT